jgi:hypothetical protein
MGCLLSEVIPEQVFYSFHSGKMDAATNIRIQYTILLHIFFSFPEKYNF